MGRVPLRVLIGVALVVVAVAAYSVVDRWMRTRIVNPVSMPISLAAGHIHTGPFRLNLNSKYWVIVSSGHGWHPELKCAYRFPRTQSRWVLYKDGKVFDRDDNPTFVNWPTSFDAGPGIYDLDLEILWDTSCLDPAHPDLRIYAFTQNYDIGAQILKLGSFVAIVLGLVILIFLPVVRSCSSEIDSIPIGSAVNAHHYHRVGKLSLRPRFSGLPSFGLYAAMFYGLIALLMVLITFGFQVTP